MTPVLRRRVLGLLLGACLALPATQASGTYPPAPPRLHADVARTIDPVIYNLGKSIFTGRADLATLPPVDPAERARSEQRLATILSRLPDRARTQLDAATLARQLDPPSVDALLYYLALRFRLPEATA